MKRLVEVISNIYDENDNTIKVSRVLELPEPIFTGQKLIEGILIEELFFSPKQQRFFASVQYMNEEQKTIEVEKSVFLKYCSWVDVEIPSELVDEIVL